MEKRISKFNGKKTFLLGVSKEGIYYWLEEFQWDCNWYWGGGYVKTYTNNKNPSLSRDINSHQHFNDLFLKQGYNAFKNFFVETPLTEKETWQLYELMESFYIAREYSDFIYRGGANCTTNSLKEEIKNDEEYERINKKIIPSIMTEIYKILGGKEYASL